MQVFVAVQVVNANAVLDCNRNADARAHGMDQFGYQLGFGHQTGTELAGLHPVRRTTHIDVDFRVAVILSHYSGLGHLERVAAA